MEQRVGHKEDLSHESDEICETHVVSKNRRKVHRDILSPPSGQIVPMVIQKITYKNILNKSREFISCEKTYNVSKNGVEQVQTQPELVTPVPASSVNIQSFDGLGKGKKRKTTAQDMVDIWNNEVSINKQQVNIKLNRAISKYLVACFKYKFNEGLNKWKHYCCLIASSPYLMSKDFVLSLSWAVKFSTIDRILAGELGVKKIEHVRTEEELRTEAFRHIDGVGEGEGCKATRRMILSAVGATHYNAWFTQVDVLDDGATLKPHNRFVEAAIQARFGDVLERVGR